MNKGFIQIPIIIVLAVLGVTTIVVGGYFAVKEINKSNDTNVSVEQNTSEPEEVIIEPDPAINPPPNESRKTFTLEEILSMDKKESEEQEQVPEKPETQEEKELSISDLTPYFTGIGSLECYSGENLVNSEDSARGTGFLVLDSKAGGHYIFTNHHVVDGFENCDFLIPPISKRQGTDDSDWLFLKKINQILGTVNGVDFATLDIDEAETFGTFAGVENAIASLNYKISSLPLCSDELPIGSKMYTIGFPAYSESTERIVLEGRISGYSGQQSVVNYFVSNAIDSGNSGSPAIAIENNKFCLAGIVTWLSQGDFQSQGVVLNSHNITNR